MFVKVGPVGVDEVLKEGLDLDQRVPSSSNAVFELAEGAADLGHGGANPETMMKLSRLRSEVDVGVDEVREEGLDVDRRLPLSSNAVLERAEGAAVLGRGGTNTKSMKKLSRLRSEGGCPTQTLISWRLDLLAVDVGVDEVREERLDLDRRLPSSLNTVFKPAKGAAVVGNGCADTKSMKKLSRLRSEVVPCLNEAESPSDFMFVKVGPVGVDEVLKEGLDLNQRVPSSLNAVFGR
ncbi:hypothetical protein M407DRAFT_22249 [Tulasnella calospora MUT 4182]|uniref:Uncharacterized protein n=1 Tax=Tulasnella calospora MUT 4182 TaxID=1051891 RepID=A0A0C3QCW4_9AGAM|nr:hypothetical protein M407DRAFT_22249 [Tulasnella calospora MUT 4182]